MAMALVDRRSAGAIRTLNNLAQYNALAWDRPRDLNAAWGRTSRWPVYRVRCGDTAMALVVEARDA